MSVSKVWLEVDELLVDVVDKQGRGFGGNDWAEGP